jgi:hypothetical protein
VREELTEAYRRMIYADTTSAVEHSLSRFTKKWQLRCPAVVESLKEAGDDLFIFLRFPAAQWKALRTTNALERINEEFRRRTKTESSLPSQDAVLLLLFGLLRSGQVKLRALVGYQAMGANNLLADESAAGRLRHIVVGIDGWLRVTYPVWLVAVTLRLCRRPPRVCRSCASAGPNTAVNC